MGLLDGKVVLITGGARGQGRAHALTSAREGADVLIVDIATQLDTVPYPMASPSDLAETVGLVEDLGRRAIAVQADVRSQPEIDRAVAETIGRLGKLDALVINHGIWSSAPFWDITDRQWEEMLGVNLSAVWRCAKAVAPHMIERGQGSIVVTASVAGFEPGFNATHYSTAKHGVVGLVRNLAYELAPHGVRCNAVAPGVIDTPMINSQVSVDILVGRPGGTTADLVAAGSHYHALKGATALPPQAVADAVLWLNSDMAASVTGVTVPVDAGHMTLPGFNHAPTS
ncbi:mycofactocin-coupled SDR family oxidoreductase [Rhodococcus sp. NPDC057529]|uniref:mycofactocin-coupled SDR family oxidoreductase n=1 Tax=Rhodococcus sp. NPDC057529 TaxID=3346158 RepID=UPI00366F706F